MPEPITTPPITLTEMINEVEREIVMRLRLYQRWIDAGQMTQIKADRQIEIMRAVSAELRKLRFDAS
jgi:hypothetical protein